MPQTSIRENLLRLRERIARAAARAGHRPEEVTLVSVSKTQPATAIREAYEAGVRHFGENRVQEWEGKRAGTDGLTATWHLIGHLQSNKAARAAKLFHSVDSVDDFALAQKLGRTRAESNAPGKLRVLLEVHLAPEATKTGVEIVALPYLAQRVAALPHLDLAGLMCIPPFIGPVEAGLQPGAVRPYFRRLRDLRDDLAKETRLSLPVLSMGMSHDFEVAIEEGATEIRVGAALFGPRP